MDRREFLKATALAGGGVAFGFYLPLGRAAPAGPAEATAFEPNAFIRLAPDGEITFISPSSEMGQGVYTSHAMLVAEEMDADFSRFHTEAAPADPAYANPVMGIMVTGGSTATRAFWEPLRKAGASARAMLVAAAAERWGLTPDILQTREGWVVDPDSGRRIAYGDLAADAAQQTPPESPHLKDPSEFRLIGRSTKRIEGPGKVDGSAVFGFDFRLPGMLTGVIARPPVFGGKPVRVKNAEAVAAMPGVARVKIVPGGVAVLADTYWHAQQARRALDVEWDDGGNGDFSTDALYTRYEALSREPGAVAEDAGDAAAALAGAGDPVALTFFLPYLAHAPMEPVNATARVTESGCEVWAGTQMQGVDPGNVAAALGMEPEQVRINTLLLGGGFGRRANPRSDFLVDAAQAAQGEDAPVKIVWDREDDIQGGWYRPLNVHRVEAALGEDGLPKAWRQRIVSQSIMRGTPFEQYLVKDGVDETSVEGATHMPYAIPARRIELHSPVLPVPVLWWRSVGHTHTGFVNEHFLDVLARKAGRDPYEYRRALLTGAGDPRSLALHAPGENARYLGVLDLAAEKAGWGNPLPEGHARGIALRKSFETYVCQVVDVSLDRDGLPVVHRVTAAVDPGIAVNPWNIEQQVQGAVAFALTALLHGRVELEGGRVRQSNFHDYQMLRMPGMPEVDVHIVPSTAPPTGIGEPGVPPLAPAVANAMLALTGRPVTRLPLTKEG